MALIHRDVWLAKDARPELIRIVRASQVGIEIEFKDYTIPSNATVKAYARRKNYYGAKTYTVNCTVSSGKVNLTPTDGFFVEGDNLLQIEVNGAIIPVALDVRCEVRVSDAGPSATPEAVLPYVTRAETAAGTASTAATTATTAATSVSESAAQIQMNKNDISSLKNDIAALETNMGDVVKALPHHYESIAYTSKSNSYYSVESDTAQRVDYTGSYYTLDPIEVSCGDIIRISLREGTTVKSRPIVVTDADYKIIWSVEKPSSAANKEYEIVIKGSSAKYILISYYSKFYSIEKVVIDPADELAGKYISVLGDSVSSYDGTLPEGNKAYYNGTKAGVTSADQMWWSVLCKAINANPLVINGWSGTCVTNGRRDESQYKCASNVERCQALHTSEHNPDIVLVAMGTNDYSYGAQLGTWDGTTAIENTNDFSQAYAYMLDKIHSAYPNAQIYCITPWFQMRGTDTGVTYKNTNPGVTANDYAERIKTIAPLIGAKVIDGGNIGFNRYNYYPTYCVDSADTPTHPNANGHYIMGKAIAKALRSMYSDNSAPSSD